MLLLLKFCENDDDVRKMVMGIETVIVSVIETVTMSVNVNVTATEIGMKMRSVDTTDIAVIGMMMKQTGMTKIETVSDADVTEMMMIMSPDPRIRTITITIDPTETVMCLSRLDFDPDPDLDLFGCITCAHVKLSHDLAKLWWLMFFLSINLLLAAYIVS